MTGQGRVAIVRQDQPPEGVCVHEFTCWIRVLPGTPDAVHGERAHALWSFPSPWVNPWPGIPHESCNTLRLVRVVAGGLDDRDDVTPADLRLEPGHGS